jgi:hypothetical protein
MPIFRFMQRNSNTPRALSNARKREAFKRRITAGQHTPQDLQAVKQLVRSVQNKKSGDSGVYFRALKDPNKPTSIIGIDHLVFSPEPGLEVWHDRRANRFLVHVNRNERLVGHFDANGNPIEGQIREIKMENPPIRESHPVGGDVEIQENK